MLPSRIAYAAVAVGAAHPLSEAEQALAERFAPRRLHTFAAGRAAARLALGSSAPIGFLPGGAPEPPQGWRLSISHTDAVAVAAACRAGEAAGLGIDVEDVSRMDPKLRRHVVGPLDTVPEDADTTLLTATFSLRESLFKALQGRSADAIYVRWDDGRVEAGVEGDPTRFRHGWTCAAGHILSYALIEA